MFTTPPAAAVAARASRGVRPTDLLILGELGLDGTVRSVRGVLASAMLARAAGMRGIIVPALIRPKDHDGQRRQRREVAGIGLDARVAAGRRLRTGARR